MQIAQIVAGYTLGGADLLRRAMGKKDPEAMAKERSKFVEGALKNNVEDKKANEIFDLMEKFAEYGFNKSHSAAYALITYHTAYLKTYYKVEFMAALLSSEIGNQDKILKYMTSCNDMDIEVKAPNIQYSVNDFTAHENAIIYGLGGIKGVGTNAIEEIKLARTDSTNPEKESSFISFFDFLCRVNLRKISRKVVEALIKSGACDCFGLSRHALMICCDTAVAKAQKKAKESNSNQLSLFSLLPAEEIPQTPGLGFDLPEMHLKEWDDELLLKHEKEVLGFFLSFHPLKPFHLDFKRLGLKEIDEIAEYRTKAEVRVPLLLTGCKEILTKKNKRMAFLSADDLTGHAEVIVFPKTYDEYKDFLTSERPIILTGTIDQPEEEETLTKGIDSTLESSLSSIEETEESEESLVSTTKDPEAEEESSPTKEIKLLANKFEFLEDASLHCEQPLSLNLPKHCLYSVKLQELVDIIEEHKGNTGVLLAFKVNNILCQMQADMKVKASPAFFKAYSEWRIDKG